MSDPQQDGAVEPPLDWMTIGQYAMLAALCDLVPVPILDSWLENLIRRRMVRAIGMKRGWPFDDEALKILGDRPSGGCTGCLLAIVLWPIKKILKTISVVFQVKGIADTFTEVVHRGLLLEEAFDAGWLPSEPERVRAAMDKALVHVDTRLVERSIRGTMRDRNHSLTRSVGESVRIARARRTSLAARAEAPPEAVAEEAPKTSRAMEAALNGGPLVPELLAWFRAEMGEGPRIEAALGGPIEPELVDGDVDEPPPRALPAPVEDAEELPDPSAPPRTTDA